MTKFLYLIFCFSILFHQSSFAESELDAVNKQVKEAVEIIETRYGVTVSYSEIQSMKISIIANKISNDSSADSTETKILNAISNFEISDEAQQRKLVIDVGTNGSGSGGGAEPPKAQQN